MEMCYDGELLMPSNFVVMDEAEMTYTEGGASYSTYRGTSAWAKISTMMASIATWCGTANKLALQAGAIAATGAGLIIALVKALGCSLAVASGGVQAAMV